MWDAGLLNMLYHYFAFLLSFFYCCGFSCRGILAIAWSMADPELLLSCGKDAKILCSNPNTGEVLYAYHFKKPRNVCSEVAHAKHVFLCLHF